MANVQKIKKAFLIVWVIVLVILWVSYPYYPGDIFFWMWLAIIWSIGGGVISTIFFMSDSKKNEKLISVIWVIILVILWLFYPFFPGDILVWYWVAIIWSIIGGILALGVYILKRNK
ncbi:MAG: hypothetical protein ACFFKA_05375 [Candidatus Thorarchaeota archaeon]